MSMCAIINEKGEYFQRISTYPNPNRKHALFFVFGKENGFIASLDDMSQSFIAMKEQGLQVQLIRFTEYEVIETTVVRKRN